MQVTCSIQRRFTKSEFTRICVTRTTKSYEQLYVKLPVSRSVCQCLWEESIDILHFLHGDNYKGKVAHSTHILLGVVSCSLPIIQIVEFFGHQYI